MKQLDYVQILQVRVLNCTMEELMEFTNEGIVNRQLLRGTGINLNQLYLLKHNPEFTEAVVNSCLLVPDGTPVMWIAKWLGTPLRAKIPGPEYTLELFRLAAEKGYRVFILGGKPGSAELAIENIRLKYENLKIAGYYCPPFGFEKDEGETNKIVDMLKNSEADILIMALGAPKQEIFAERYYQEINIPIIFGSGIAIDYFAGRVKKAPGPINKLGLEWLYRLFQEPKRLFERYIVHDLPLLLELRKWAKKEKKRNPRE